MATTSGRPSLDGAVYKLRYREEGKARVVTWYCSNEQAFQDKLQDPRLTVTFAARYESKEVYIQ